MKRLQMKYNCIQFLYWITNCTIFGYIAIFLQYKGLSKGGQLFSQYEKKDTTPKNHV